jgi:hypothetical protein
MAFLRVVESTMADPSKMDPGAVRNDSLGLLAALHHAPGLQHWFSGRDPITGEGRTCSIWDTREQAEAGALAVIDVREQLAARGVQQQRVLVIEVLAEVKPNT